MINTSNNPKYTFLLPAYKGRFLKEMLDSIQGQTYTNFKVLISDDCSPEDLYSICEPYLDDLRFEYRRNENNIGAERLVDHWNMLLSSCDTEYCILASDDDVFDDVYLECMNSLVEENPDANVLRPRIRKVNESGYLIKEEQYLPSCLSLNQFCHLWGINQISSGIPYYMYKTDRLKYIGGFVDYPCAWFSDDATVMKLLEGSIMPVSDKVLFSFRLSSFSISSTVSYKTVKNKVIASNLFFSLINHSMSMVLRDDTQFNVRNRIRMTLRDTVFSCNKWCSLKASLICIGLPNKFLSIRWKFAFFKKAVLNLFRI